MENQPFDEEHDSNYSVMLSSGLHVNVTARYAADYDNLTSVTFYDVDDNVVAHFNDVSYWMKAGLAQEVKP